MIEKNLTLQYYLGLAALFFSFLLMVAYTAICLPVVSVDKKTSGVGELFLQLEKKNELIGRGILKSEVDVDDASLKSLSDDVLSARLLREKASALVAVQSGNDSSFEEVFSRQEKMEDSVVEYILTTMDYLRAKEDFYLSRKSIDQKIVDERYVNDFQLKSILDSVQRQVGFLLQSNDDERMLGTINFIHSSRGKLKVMAPELEGHLDFYLSSGLLAIEKNSQKNALVYSILFNNSSSLKEVFVELQGDETAERGDGFVYFGLSFLVLVSFCIFLLSKKIRSDYYSQDLDSENFDSEVFKEIGNLIRERNSQR